MFSHGKAATSWWDSTVPPTGPVGTADTWVGVTVEFVHPGRVFGLRMYRTANDSQSHVAVFSTDGDHTLLAAKAFFDNEVLTAQWQQAWLHPTVRVNTTTRYRVSILFPQGHYFRRNGYLPGGIGVTVGDIRFMAGYQFTGLDVSGASPTMNTNANAVDVLFQAD